MIMNIKQLSLTTGVKWGDTDSCKLCCRYSL